MYNKSDHYCIDGFPTEGNPCVVVLPPPFREGYVYQSIKPAVIVLNGDVGNEIKDHIQNNYLKTLEKLKLKR